MKSRKTAHRVATVSTALGAPVRPTRDPRAAGVLQLQQTIGNQAVVALLRPGGRPRSRRQLQRAFSADDADWVTAALAEGGAKQDEVEKMFAWLAMRFTDAGPALELITSDYEGLRRHGSRDARYAYAPPAKTAGTFPTLGSLEQYVAMHYRDKADKVEPKELLAQLPRDLQLELTTFRNLRQTLAQNPQLSEHVYRLIRWYVPLKRREVPGIPNQEGAKVALTVHLSTAAAALKARGRGTEGGLPSEALIEHADPNADTYGVRSAVITALPGALLSGEPTEGGLTDEEKAIRTEQAEEVHEGHLVGAALGGKNARWNLTPLPKSFNTGAFKNFEKGALDLLKAGRVIAYETQVTYEYGLPVLLDVRYETRELRPDGTPTKILDWWLPEKGSQRTKPFDVPWPRPRRALPAPAPVGPPGSTTTTTSWGGPYDSDSEGSRDPFASDSDSSDDGSGMGLGWGSDRESESEGEVEPAAKRPRT